MTTIDELVAFKKESYSPFENKYIGVMMVIENDLLTHSDYSERIKHFVNDTFEFDSKAKLMILHQFARSKPNLVNNLQTVLDMNSLTRDESFLETKYENELLNNF